MSYLTNLSVLAFTPDGQNLLGNLQDITIRADNTVKDASGLADRFEFNQAVKQQTQMDFTVTMPSLISGLKASNLDITLWTIGGTAYLGQLRSGQISVTTKTSERSSIAQSAKFAQAVKTPYTVTSDFAVLNSAAFTKAMVNAATPTAFDVVAQITYGAETFEAPMVLKSASHEIKNESVQMEKVVLEAQGAPSSPVDTSLLGLVLTGNAAISIAVDTGANQYYTGSYASPTANALITKLDVKFADEAIIHITGTLMTQGPLAAS